jgi:hypothetical protein
MANPGYDSMENDDLSCRQTSTFVLGKTDSNDGWKQMVVGITMPSVLHQWSISENEVTCPTMHSTANATRLQTKHYVPRTPKHQRTVPSPPKAA